jgi:GTPase SAR1 family protein
MYKVELMCFSDENSDSTSSFTLRDDEAASRNDATDSDNNVVYCKIYDVELVEDINSGGQNPGVIEAVKEMKPQSTVGIDIDIWRPAMASDFKTRYREHQAELVKVAAKGESTSQLQRADKDLNGEDYCSSFDEVNRFSLLKFDDEDVSPKQSFVSPDDIPPSPAPARDLVLSIWDFAGQEIYHAAQEAFFSEQSLYIVVWNMTMNSESEMDLCVQFWIDLIQSRAPGSIIVIVATHADKFAKKSPRRRNSKSTCKIDCDNHIQDRNQWTPTALCQRLSQHLKKRESFRKEVLTKNIAEAIDEGNGEELKHLKVLRRNRPKICPIYPVSCTTMSGFDDLTEKIINLSTPNKKNKHPFQVDVPITRCFDRVKRVIRSLRHSGNNVVTVKQLHSQLLKTETPLAFKKDSLAAQLSQHSLSEVQDAISFLSGIGEVVWFPRSTTHKKVRMEKVDGVTVTQTAMSSSLLDSIPQMGNRGRSCSSASSGTACSIDEWDEMTWREVDEVHAGRDNDSDADNVSHVVFLNPHWLMDVLKRVLTHNLIDDFRTLATRFDPIEEKKYFGESHSDHTKNGIVRWNLIEDHLIRLDNNFLIHNDKNVVTALR